MTLPDRSRRALWAGSAPAPIRPPWAHEEAVFVDLCTRCQACTEACPQQIIEVGDGGFPQLSFARGGCTLCHACVAACTPQALVAQPGRAPWRHVARIDNACLALHGVMCRSCDDLCDSGALRFHPQPGGLSQPAIEAELCSGCGACVSPCPVQAVTMQAGPEALPPKG